MKHRPKIAEQRPPWRERLVVVLLRWLIIPLLGRPIQVVAQDAERGGLHHAPGCGANHFHWTRPITRKCTCGAEVYWRKDETEPRLKSTCFDFWKEHTV